MTRLAFYDLDGTLCSSNVVVRYAFFARHHPSKARALLKCGKLLLSVPVMIGLDFYSRTLFNEIFYREYRGMKKEWLQELEGTSGQDVGAPKPKIGSSTVSTFDE